MSKILQIIVTILATTSLTFAAYATDDTKEVEIVEIEEANEEVKLVERPVEKIVVKQIEKIEAIEEIVIEEPVEEIVEESVLTEDEIDLIALVTMAEAEGEPEEGKRLVIDTILNRIDHDRFPDTVYDVVYQKNQFTSMTNGRVNRCYVKDDICELVREEMVNRTNYDVIFFTANRYGKYGQPMFSVANHYFSSYN